MSTPVSTPLHSLAEPVRESSGSGALITLVTYVSIFLTLLQKGINIHSIVEHLRDVLRCAQRERDLQLFWYNRLKDTPSKTL
jgi:hypothetical protein